MDGKNLRLGRMFGDAYRLWQEETYGALAAKGYPDIRPAHSPVFRYIQPQGSRIVALAAAAGMTKQSMAYLVGDLEEAGYLLIEPDPADGRARLIRLTAKGTHADETIAQSSRELEARVASAIGEEKVDGLRALMAEMLVSQNEGETKD